MRDLKDFLLDSGDTELLFILEFYNMLQVTAFYLKHEEDCMALVSSVYGDMFCNRRTYQTGTGTLMSYITRVLRNEAQAYYVTLTRNMYDSIEDWEGLCSEGE